MPWKQRGNRTYFYWTRRRGGRVVQEYWGTGLKAELAKALASEDREIRAERRQADRAALDGWRKADDVALMELASLDRRARQAATRHLVALGYYRDVRRRWRIPRVTTRKRLGLSRPKTRTAASMGPSGAPESAAPFLPDLSIARVLAKTWGEENTARIEAEWTRYVDRLAGPEPSVAVRSLAEVAGLAWLRLRAAEANDAATELTGGRSVALAKLAQRRIGQDQRRLASLIECVCRVRRLESRAPLNTVNVLVTGPTVIKSVGKGRKP